MLYASVVIVLLGIAPEDSVREPSNIDTGQPKQRIPVDSLLTIRRALRPDAQARSLHMRQ